MKLTKYEHSCVLVEHGDARVLVDPGNFSHGFEELTGLTAVLVTHQHPDHLDVERLPQVLDRNPDAALYTDPGTAEVLAGMHIEATTVQAGDHLDLGVGVDVHGEQHAVIHPEIPVVPNVGYLFDGRFFHPGDSFTPPPVDVEILGLPTAAPWQKLSEAIDFLRAVSPAVAIPIHQAILAKPELYYGHFQRLGPERTELRLLETADTVTL
ncbi:MBL fold metallo-hydrolase [Phytoactinopolyspora halotolerans]|uniref:MBL fold metallo-hydrolase n=1 Tax=Phytoactinopolyspora halotolerans TaxID=1981512 RepID=A0A6L9SF57_9ACTN|nr:MBL fold metallo-hydrolase [Phytoactinopolyspora halotolerans]NEE03856.1 MBL fold metallo-hydrolase [Phytoactinopolyspora halotolerans]